MHACRVIAGQFNRVPGPHGDFGKFGFEPSFVQRVFDRLKVGVGRQHLNRAIVVSDHVFSAQLKRRVHQFVFVRARRKHQLAAVLELEGDGARRAHVAAMLAERVTHLGHGAHLVVGHGVHNDGRAANAVAFVADFLIVHAFQRARGFFNVAFDCVGRQIGGFGFFHCQAQARVDAQIAATQPGRHHDFTDHPRPHFAPLFVLAAFSVLNIGPFTVSCHGESSKYWLRYWFDCTFWNLNG